MKFGLGRLFGGIVGIGKMGDDIADQRGLLAVAVDPHGHRPLVMGHFLVPGRSDEIVQDKRIIGAREIVQCRVIVDEGIAFDHAAGTNLGAKGCATHKDVVADRDVGDCGLDIQIVVIVAGRHRLG